METNNRVWSEQQVAVHNWFKSGTGNAAVVARAGTGKTTLVTHGITLAPEGKILYAVFAKRNALEAQEKIRDPRVDVKTLHAVGYGYIRKAWPGARPDDAVELDRIAAATKSYRDVPNAVISSIKQLVTYAKNVSIDVPTVDTLADLAEAKGFLPEGNYEEEGWTIGRIAEVARDAMKAALVQDAQKRISFGDMVWLPVVQNWVRGFYDLVSIDECQDMSAPQLLMAQRACRKGGRILVIGDPRQCIFAFRGAKFTGMEDMIRDLNATVFPLTITYRCPKTVVALAATMVPDYQAAETAPQGSVTSAPTSAMLAGAKPGDAILSRVNAPLMGHCLALLKAGVPARIEGRDIGRDLLATVRKLKARTIPELLGKIETWAEKQMKRASSGKNAESRIDNINDTAECLTALARDAVSVADVENKLQTLFSDTADKPRPAVVFSSCHKAKGLEWSKVYLLQKTFKVRGNTLAVTDASNLAYVAITRAKADLVWVDDSAETEKK